MEKTSLSAFAKTHNIPKSSLHRKAKELGIDTSAGLSETDREKLIESFSKSQSQIVVQSSEIGSLPTPEELLTRYIESQKERFETIDAEILEIEEESEEIESRLQQLANIAHQNELKLLQRQVAKQERLERKRELEKQQAIAMGKLGVI